MRLCEIISQPIGKYSGKTGKFVDCCGQEMVHLYECKDCDFHIGCYGQLVECDKPEQENKLL